MKETPINIRKSDNGGVKKFLSWNTYKETAYFTITIVEL